MSTIKKENHKEKNHPKSRQGISLVIEAQLHELFKENCTRQGMTITGRIKYLMYKDLGIDKNLK